MYVRGSAYKIYLLVILVAVFAFSLVDTLALALIQENVKSDLDLSDTQLGVLTGAGYWVIYAAMGVPIARWADRGDRVTIIAISVGVWSLGVVSTAMAGTFPQLVLMRILAAVGAAGCMAPANSLISDVFTREERPQAFSRYMFAIPLVCVIGYFVAGWLNERYGWRTTLATLGLPGIALAALVKLTVSEPRKERLTELQPRPVPCDHADASGLHDVWRPLWVNGTFRYLLLGNVVYQFVTNGIQAWQAVFFIRKFGLKSGEVGIWLAVIGGVFGLLGTWLGGEWATRSAPGERRQLQAVALGFASYGALLMCAFLLPNYHLAFLLMGLASVGLMMVMGVMYAGIQAAAPVRTRATAVAAVALFSYLIGALGPSLVGVLSDALHYRAGPEPLRYVLVSLCPGYLWSAWFFWRAARTVPRDLKHGHVDQDALPKDDAALPFTAGTARPP